DLILENGYESVRKLGTSINVFYIYVLSISEPNADVLLAINELYKASVFKKFVTSRPYTTTIRRIDSSYLPSIKAITLLSLVVRILSSFLYFVKYNSALKPKHGDVIIISSSSTEQLEQTLEGLDHGPLPAEVVEKIDSVWETIKHVAPLDNFADGMKPS
ncbi:hypothetical protein D6D20_10536, partial [Aureobasidium pullulans]